MAQAGNTLLFDRFYENLTQATLMARVVTGQIYWFEKTKPGSELDRNGVDFIIHEKLDSSPLYLQVKSTHRGSHKGSPQRRLIRNNGGKVRTRGEERKEYFSRGIKLLTLRRDSTPDEAWARIWFLLHTEELRSPGADHFLWDGTQWSLKRLLCEQVIDAYEPKSLDVWTIRRGERTVEFSLPPEKPIGSLYEQISKILSQSLAIA
ncbi:MAG: hypothetical protein AAB486_01445 [Patescibacteria group bacterium]